MKITNCKAYKAFKNNKFMNYNSKLNKKKLLILQDLKVVP